MVKIGLRTLIHDETDDFRVVGEAEDGAEALVLIDRLEPDLLLTDIRMPIMDGLELLREIRSKQLRMETVLVSGYGEFSYAQEALRYGAADYLLKPIHSEALLGLLGRLRTKWCSPSGMDARLISPIDDVLEERDPLPSTMLTEADSCHAGYKQIVSQALVFIESRFADPQFSLKEAASHFYLSPAYFSFMFKKIEGVPFIQYLTRLRMELAKRMLGEPSNKIYVIGHAVGYPEYTHFTKAFKKYTGYSLTEYRLLVEAQEIQASRE
jgi:two-component system response regulator YesN